MAQPAPQLQLLFLGPPEVRLGAHLLTFRTRKTLALLVYLALEAGPQPRDHLAALLWPNASPERSYASLRNTLGHLQSALRQAGGQPPAAFLSISHTDLALNPEAGSQVDLHLVEQAYTLARADRSSRTPLQDSASLPVLQSAAARYRGDFLTGFSLGDAPGFDDWAATQREVWRRRLGLILDRLSEIEFANGDYASTAETTALWIALDSLNEVAYRRKMRAHFAAGERGQALATYEACQAVLRAELNVEPEPDTEALALRIRTQRPLALPAPRPDQPDTPVAFLENLFAGRVSEHQALVERYLVAAAGQAQGVVLRGEAGIGKTRLAQEFLTWAEAQGAEVLRGRAFETGSRMSYQPLIDAFRPVFEQEDTPQAWLGDVWLASLSRLLPELRESYPDLPIARVKADSDRTQLFESLARLTLGLGERAPLVLFVDDLQWADSATLDWLPYAARRWREAGARIFLLVNLPSEAFQAPVQPGLFSLIDWAGQLERELELVQLELGPLGKAETTQMVLSILASPVADFAQWAFDETRGQPFYLVETLKDLLERGALHPRRRADGQWAFEVDAEHDLGQAVRVPSTVGAVVRSRLNRLSPDAFTLLAAGAVLERRLTFEGLCAIANMAGDKGLSALDELLSGRLLREVAEAGAASAYVFAHHMIRDVVYTEAGDARRRLFHRRTLAVLEAAHASPAVLAYHALAAGMTGVAFRYSLAAGREALRLSAVNEALAQFEIARQLTLETSLVGSDHEPHILELYLQLSQTYELAGRLEQARAVNEESARRFPTSTRPVI